MEKPQTEIKKTIMEIKAVLGKILEKNNGEFPKDMPSLEIEINGRE